MRMEVQRLARAYRPDEWFPFPQLRELI